MISSITMMKDIDCVQCAILDPVMEEYCKKESIRYRVIQKEDIPMVLRPGLFPCFILYDDYTNAQLILPAGELKRIKKFGNLFTTFMENNW